MNNRLFAIGDIHGCFDSLKELVEHKIKLQKNDKLILLGDYIDRGEKSKETIDFIIQLQEKGYDIVTLLGNHEAMLLDAYVNKDHIFKWIQNGGSETLKSFKINSLNDIESKYFKFFKELIYYYSFGDFLFVHAGFNDKSVNPFEDRYSMLWNCQEFYTNPLLINKTIVHGHCLISVSKCKDRIAAKLNTINIDTGCVFNSRDGYGVLTAFDCYANRIDIV
ncbi:MAG: serine/threonine protein phosphatase [Bacteroidetes bacterium]|nr:serine/threonine protein phosphatase [Bacteroidota bacterium]